jgi:hypothetical protein
MYMKQVKFVKLALVAAAVAVTLGSALPAAALNGGEYASDNWQNYYSMMIKPMVAKMEMAHRSTMTKMDLDHKMTILKMRQELESFIFSKGAF